jgi:hypothetical protein
LTTSLNATVSKWVSDQQDLLEAVTLEAAQRVAEEANRTRAEGGSMPVDTGFLRASQYGPALSMPATREAPPRPKGHKPGDPPIYNAQPYQLLVNWKPGEPIYLGWVANYASYVNSHGALFLDLAVQRWPQIVAEVESELSQRLGR